MKVHKLLLGLTCLTALASAEHPTSFDQAKHRAEDVIYPDHLVSFYCGCNIAFSDEGDIDGDGKLNEKPVFPANCGYEPRRPFFNSGKVNVRAERVEWEHVMPAHLIGGQLDEWQNQTNYEECRKSNGKYLSGRDCAYKLVPLFKKAHDDLHNLVPAVGELNADRSNYGYASIQGELREYGACDFEIDFELDVAEPADTVKGNVARIYFYMLHQYGAELDQATFNLMTLWNVLDPVDEWECERNRRIEESQGNDNPFVSAQCK